MRARLRQEPFLAIFLAPLVAYTLLHPHQALRYPELVDWPTIWALAGLLSLTTGLKESNAFHHLARRLLARLHTLRGLAAVLVGLSAGLSMFLTNDITLFVVVPLTLAAGRASGVGVGRLVVCEAIAVNAGSSLTPMGNPQNLFLWHHFQIPFAAFVRAMLPLELILLGLLAALVWLVFPPRPIRLAPEREAPGLRLPLLLGSGAGFAAFLAAVELGWAGWGLPVVLGAYLCLAPRVLLRVRWSLIVLFAVMFVDLHLLGGWPPLARWLEGVMARGEAGVFLAGLASSQVLSNLPATMLLARFTSRWPVLAWAVNLAGNGLAPASLANLIAVQLAGGGLWGRFHRLALPFMGVSALAAWLWLAWGG